MGPSDERTPVVSVTDTSFEREVIASELPVLIDLFADWCQPCKQLSPLVERLAIELEGRLKVVKVDVDRNPLVAQSFRVQSIPFLVVMNKGEVVGHHLGLLDEAGLRRLVKPFISSDTAEMSPAELAALLRERGAVPVDIRDAAAFARFRIPGAIHVPAADLDSRATTLRSSDGRVRVLYSRTTDEAKTAAEVLRKRGIEVAFLAGGFLHWEADGLEVERGG